MTFSEKKTPLEAAIEAAEEFKLLLDVQPSGTLFNPGGEGDVLSSATYARASALLEMAIAQGSKIYAHLESETVDTRLQIAPLANIPNEPRATEGMPVRLLRTKAIEQMTGFSRTEIYNRVKKNIFPKPLRLGHRSLAWVASDVEEWIKRLAREADK